MTTNKKYLIVTLVIVVGIGIAYFLGTQRNNLVSSVKLGTSVTVSNNRELSEWYSVEYPPYFFITRKSSGEFGVAEKRWEGNLSHIPEAGITVYTNVIPGNMSLKDWLNGIGDQNPPVGNQGTPKSCKAFLDKIRLDLKYGDLFNNQYLKGSDCLYFGVSDVKDKKIANLQAIEFKTQNVSSGATHTIFTYQNQSGSTLLFDIFYTATGQSDETDKTVYAYISFLRTFKTKTSQKDTSSWKTFTAVDKTFSFKFPNQWIIQPNQVFGSRSVTEFQFQNNPLFTVTLLGNYNQITGQPFKTLEEYLGVKDAKSMGFLLDGRQAKRVTDPGQAGHVVSSEEVVIFYKDNKFIVSVYFEPDYYPQAKENKTFDQILSSFKFTQ